MTSHSLTRKVQALAGKYRVEPGFSLRCLGAALKLAEYVKPEDVVLWPVNHGGLAWEACLTSDKTKSKLGKGGRVFCILRDDFPETPELWGSLDEAAASAGSGILRIKLSAVSDRPEISGKDRYPEFLSRFLDRIFPVKEPSLESPVQKTAEPMIKSLQIQDLPLTAGEKVNPVNPIPEAYLHWLEKSQTNIHIDTNVDLRERFLAAGAASMAGLTPVISLASGESSEAALLTSRYFSAGNRALIRIRDDWAAASSFQVLTNVPILTPASDSDLTAAVEWAFTAGNPILILEPGRTSISARAVLKKPWDTNSCVVVKETKGRAAGNILLIAPGTLVREAVKSADRLVKDDFSVTVLSVRFLRPLVSRDILKNIAAFDLVVIVDPADLFGGVKNTLGLQPPSSGEPRIVIYKGAPNGRNLADFASEIHRESRFQRTVDDVKKDRW